MPDGKSLKQIEDDERNAFAGGKRSPPKVGSKRRLPFPNQISPKSNPNDCPKGSSDHEKQTI
jgi:hypothetical protein